MGDCLAIQHSQFRSADTNPVADILKKNLEKDKKREKRGGGTREKHAAQDAIREKGGIQDAAEHTKHAAEHVGNAKFRIIIIF